MILGDLGRAENAFLNALDINPSNETAFLGIQRIRDPDSAPAAIPDEEVAAPAPSRAAVGAEKIQTALKNAGLYTGRVDGKIGPATLAAIRTFQASRGLEVDGKVGLGTWAALEPYLGLEEKK
ncbi:MAG: peptidoglycan-binding protein [Candidatus Omnitrophica bacterium]|nr:peptidoglycan-binding protein [Candidatus Omnitrophota bacterium]